MIIRCLYDKLVPIEELKKKFHPKNRNRHPPEQIERLAKILNYQGIRYCAKISKLSDFITSGHGRVLAAELNGWTEFPVNYQDYDSSDQEYMDVQADNAVASWSELDLSSIQNDLKDLPNLDIDLLGIKDFSLAAIDVLEPGCDDDEVPEAPVEPITKLGDFYQLGSHRLLCGDSTSIDAVEKLMGGEKADMVFTDPPYGMSYKSNAWDSKRDNISTKRTDREISGDDTTDTATDAIRLIPLVFNTEGHIFIWCRWDSFETFRIVASEFSTIKGNLVWDKGDSPGLGDLECSFGGNELAVHSIIGRRKIKNRINSVWRVNRPKGVTMVHPTQKPIEIIEPALENCSRSGDIVLDLFGGSGSTLIACEKTNRKCLMSELDPHYVDVIVQRWMKYSGKMAYLIEDSSGLLKEPVPYVEMDSFRGENMQDESKSTVGKNVGRSGDHTEIKNVKNVTKLSQ